MSGRVMALPRMAGIMVVVDKEESPDTMDTDTTAVYRKEPMMYEGFSQDMIHEVHREEEIDGNRGPMVNLRGMVHLDILHNPQRVLDMRYHLDLT